MAEHTERMGKEREKNNSWGLAKAECRYHKFMSARFEAFPRQWDDAKWLVLLPRVFVPVYLCAQCCCFSVCTHACIILSVTPPPFISIQRDEHWLIMWVLLPVSDTSRTWGKTVTFKKKIDSLIVLLFSRAGKLEEWTEHMFCWRGHSRHCVMYYVLEIDTEGPLSHHFFQKLNLKRKPKWCHN